MIFKIGDSQDENLSKVCTSCFSMKSLSEFFKKKSIRSGRGAKCKECQNKIIRAYMKVYRQSSVRKNYMKKYRTSEPYKERINKKRKSSLQFKLSQALRVRMVMALKNNQKVGSAVRDLGCSVEELKTHLEKSFKEGMSWDNWKHRGGWHIDHIRPLASFNLSDRAQFLEACHYTNLQPLWASENLKKGKTYESI